MSSFYLKILASNKVFFSGKADILVVPGLDGEIAIMAHHQNMAIATTIGDVRFKPEGSEEYVDAVVGIGFVYIANNRVTMIVDTAERPEDIDEVRAKAVRHITYGSQIHSDDGDKDLLRLSGCLQHRAVAAQYDHAVHI